MAFSETIIAIAAFLSVSAVAVFLMLVIGIRQGARAQHLSYGPDTALDALTRRFLGVGTPRNQDEEN